MIEGLIKENILDTQETWQNQPEDVKHEVIHQRNEAFTLYLKLSPLSKGDLKVPIDSKLLTGQPYSQTVVAFLYLYSLETFIPKAINEAQRKMDASKI